MDLSVNVIKVTADAFDWTIEKTAQSLQTFLDGNYYLVAYVINICYIILKSITEIVSFSGYVLRCYYLDFLAFLSELNAGVSFVFKVIYGFCSRIVLSVLTVLGCVSGSISSLYFKIVFGFHLIGYYITVCVEELVYFLNVCFAAVLLILQLGPNFLLFLCNTLFYCVTSIINFLHFTALTFSHFSANICNKCVSFILSIPPKAYLGLLILLYVFYTRATIWKFLKLTLKSFINVVVKIVVYLWITVKLFFSLVQVAANKALRRFTRTRRSERTLNQVRESVYKKYFSNIVSFLTLSIFRKEHNIALDPIEKEKFTCVVCQDQEKNVLLIPCRHLCMCEDCTTTVLQSHLGCPLCRKTILDTVRVYT